MIALIICVFVFVFVSVVGVVVVGGFWLLVAVGCRLVDGCCWLLVVGWWLMAGG